MFWIVSMAMFMKLTLVVKLLEFLISLMFLLSERLAPSIGASLLSDELLFEESPESFELSESDDESPSPEDSGGSEI